MKESFLHFIWQQGLFDALNLSTTNGEKVLILNRGILNHDSGPDFFNSKIEIDQGLWSGNTEIHIKASDWNLHKHQKDKAYNNTILHVVWEFDTDVYRMDGSVVPCIELKNRIEPEIFAKYENLENSIANIPCADNQPGKFTDQIENAIQLGMLERIASKSAKIHQLAAETKNDWQSVFYISIARYLGFKVNGDAMETLARITPQLILAKCMHEPKKIEALLFGQAGFLHGKQLDLYTKGLKQEYSFLQKKYALEPMSVAGWKFMRMRPANFPTIRIAQLAKLVHSMAHSFSKILEEMNLDSLRDLFRVEANPYWNTHYRFGLLSTEHPKIVGESTLNGLVINAVIPNLYAYGKYAGRIEYQERAMKFLRQLAAEDNKITREFEGLGFPNGSAYQSQGLIGLRNHFCGTKKCDVCPIGMRIISL